MLCPEVWNFPAPKVIESKKVNQDLVSVKNTINRNWYYKSIIITFPDEIQTPSFIQEILTDDSDYYKLSAFSITEFVEPIFIESFIKTGKIYCLSADRDCIVQNCFAITPDGALILHIHEHVFQTLGFEGTKRPHGFYEVKIDLKSVKNYEKTKLRLSKLELFDCHLKWEPYNENICPSSIAKYFHDTDVSVSVHSLKIKSMAPDILEVPSVKDVDIEEMTEWIGMLAHQADLNPAEPYISSYSQPESEMPLKTTRISLYVAKGFISNSSVSILCEKLNEYLLSRETANYWASLSLQSDENSLWQWDNSSPRMFQSHDSSCNIYFTHHGHIKHMIGQLKYS